MLGFLMNTLLTSGLIEEADEDWEEQMVTHSKRIVSQYSNIFDSPAQHASCDSSTDAILLGNGDMAVAISGTADHLRFWLNKNDFWRMQNQYSGCKPALLGGVDVLIPSMKSASYHAEQDIYTATTSGTFSTPETTVSMKCLVSATQNVFMLEFAVEGEPVEIELKLWTQQGSDSENAEGHEQGDILDLARVHADGEETEIFSGERLTFKTVKDEIINLYPTETGNKLL